MAHNFERNEMGSYEWFVSNIGRLLDPQLGADHHSYDRGVLETCYDIIQQGLADFYYPTPQPDGAAHKWSFLTVQLEVPIIANKTIYQMPRDFGSTTGNLWFTGSDDGYAPVEKTSLHNILEKEALNTNTTSHPLLYAEQRLEAEVDDGQGWQLRFWPTPNAAYHLIGEQNIEPGDIDSDHRFPYGGRKMAMAQLQCMKALLNPKEQEKAMTMLAAAIQADRIQGSEGMNLGKNNDGDGLSGVELDGNGRFLNHSAMTYNGVDYSGA